MRRSELEREGKSSCLFRKSRRIASCCYFIYLCAVCAAIGAVVVAVAVEVEKKKKISLYITLRYVTLR